MNSSPSNPEGDPTERDFPLFASTQSTFSYRVNHNYRGRYMTILYTTVHEVILNLQSFNDTDTITYLERSDSSEFITVPIGEFKTNIARDSLLGTAREA
jgi:hypothetical protein